MRQCLVLPVPIGLCVAPGSLVLPYHVDASMNRIVRAATPALDTDAPTPHAQLRIADLHHDRLPWSLRHPMRRHGRGQTDVPRLPAGNVTAQLLSSASRTTWGRHDQRHEASVTRRASTQRRPLATWASPFARARRTAEALAAAAASNGLLRVVRSAPEVERDLADRAAGAGRPRSPA
jgi:hypothetical protein